MPLLLDENSIHTVNEMLMQHSHNTKLNQDQRFEQQLRLRDAIFIHQIINMFTKNKPFS
ncbi:DUF2526 family protein [Providencia sp.]|uniref:DUF2526 family protein n=1 Tax=Providencia sp. TaxID=589 RepID=UPI003341FCC5